MGIVKKIRKYLGEEKPEVDLTELTGMLAEINKKLLYLEILDRKIDDLSNVQGIKFFGDFEAAVKRVTVKDKEALEVLKKGVTDAKELAKKLNIKRSTASLRLNKLANMGFLEKYSEGKTIKYKLKEESVGK